jgi:hypothetical protein
VRYEVRALVRDYAHPEGPQWAPLLDPLGRPVRHWERSQAVAVVNSIAASINGRACRIVEVEPA